MMRCNRFFRQSRFVVVSLSLAAALSNKVAHGADPGKGESITRVQRGCFCVKPTGSAFQPYQIWMYPTEQFGNCAGVDTPKLKAPWEQLLNCGELQDCLKLSTQCESEKAKARSTEATVAWSKRCANLKYECFEQPLVSREIGHAVVGSSEDSLRADIRNAEKAREEAQSIVNKECGVSGLRSSSSGSDACKKAKEDVAAAQARLDGAKLASIKLVRALEGASNAMRRAADAACSAPPHRKPSDPQGCNGAKTTLGATQKALEKATESVKKEIYGCKNWLETFLECSNVTLEGAKLTVSDWGKALFGPKSDKKGESASAEAHEEGNSSLRERILIAKQDAMAGRLKDCKRSGDKFTCRSKDGKSDEQVDYTVYKGWELAHGKIKPATPILGKMVAEKQEGAPAARQEKKAEGVKATAQTVRAAFDLANRLKDDLRDTAKWPSAKLNPSNVKNYDPDLRAKYEEQMRLANAIKSNPGANPADLAKALNIKSDPIGNLGAPSFNSKEGSVKPGGKSMKIVDRNGKLTDMNVFVCPRIQGFVTVEKNGVLYCQEAAKIAIKTVAAVKDAKSVTGYRIVASCAKTDSFHATNWAGKGTGECRPAKDDMKK